MGKINPTLANWFRFLPPEQCMSMLNYITPEHLDFLQNLNPESEYIQTSETLAAATAQTPMRRFNFFQKSPFQFASFKNNTPSTLINLFNRFYSFATATPTGRGVTCLSFGLLGLVFCFSANKMIKLIQDEFRPTYSANPPNLP